MSATRLLPRITTMFSSFAYWDGPRKFAVIEVRGKTALIMHNDASILHALGLIPMMNRFSQFCALAATLAAFSGCGTVSDLVTSNLPEKHSGRPSIIVSLREQEAYLYRGGYRTASSRISSGREGYRTPIGRFQVIRKDEDHRF